MAVASSAYKKALEGDQTPKEVLVKIDRVTKKFDETVAVDDVSLTINKGEIFALPAELIDLVEARLHAFTHESRFPSVIRQ